MVAGMFLIRWGDTEDQNDISGNGKMNGTWYLGGISDFPIGEIHISAIAYPYRCRVS